MSIGFRIPDNANIHDSFDYGDVWGNQVSKTPLDEVPVSELKNFLPAPDLSISQRGRHVVSMSYRARSDVIKRGTVPHLLPELWQEPPKI